MSEAPNTDIHCNTCNKKITSCCMLSPDWSLKDQFLSAMITMREHFLKEHKMENPTN